MAGQKRGVAIFVGFGDLNEEQNSTIFLGSTSMIERHAVRALLLTPQEELLLIKIIEPKSKRAFWLTPGGGMHPGEDAVTCLRREIFEETGLTHFDIGPEIWRREHRFTWAGKPILQRERFYLVNIDRFEPIDHHLPDQVEQDAFGGFRWWQAQEIAPSSEAFAPRRLGPLLQSLIQDGPPAQPIFLTE